MVTGLPLRSPRPWVTVRIFQHQVVFSLLLLACVEGVLVLLAPVVAAAVIGSGFASWFAVLIDAVVFTGATVLGFTALGLYSRRQRARLFGVVGRIAGGILVGGGAVATLSYLLPHVELRPRVLALAATVALLATAFVRLLFDRLAAEDTFKRRVLIFGAGRRAAGVSELRRRSDVRGFHVVGFAALGDERTLVADERLVAPGASLLRFCQEQEVDEVVIAMDDRRRSFPVHELLECRLNGIEVIDIVDFLERETGKVRLDVLNPSWIIFSPGFDRSRWRVASKRAFDVLASLGLLLIAWPFMAFAVIAIAVEDGWRAPVFYRQRRVGLDGVGFDVLKFRSMRVDAETPGKAQWAKKKDARVTRVGGFIRKVRIDELPQILNVLRGDMSFVGPRPERPEFVTDLENRIPYYRERHCVKPGITGWAQLCYPYGSSEKDAAEKLQYDLYYVKNHSLLFDLMILLQTAEVVLLGQGAR
jgi:sugar transferase (PEP-CTERM system associated)